MSAPRGRRYQAGGALAPGAIYAERRADRRLLDALLAGDYCHVLAPRQVGKTSLCGRTIQRLEELGHRGVIVDLQTIGVTPSADEWYASVADLIALQLNLDVDVKDYWRRHADLSRPMRLQRFLRDAVLTPDPRPVSLIFDEVEHLLALPEVRPDFLSAVRGMFNARASDLTWARLTVACVGVATVRDLASGDARLTPFNIAQEIHLDDLTREEMAPLAEGLVGLGAAPDALLEALWSWTAGHPALSQQLCAALVAEGAHEGAADERVKRHAERLFLRRGRAEHPILLDTQQRFEREDDALVPRMLAAYEGILRNGEQTGLRDPEAMVGLRIAGLVQSHEGVCLPIVRNRVYAAHFDQRWVDEHPARAARRASAARRPFEAAGPPAVGAVVGGRYTLLKRLGEGGFGACFRARDEVVGRDVVVKSHHHPPPERLPELRRALARAARLGEGAIGVFGRDPRALQPHLYDMVISEDPYAFYVVMELLEGRSLRDHLVDRGRCSARESAALLRDLACVLDAAHALSPPLVHGDLKPSNLFVTTRRGAHALAVLDLGEVEGYAREETIIGSPPWMAPEQWEGRRLPQSDIWALGMITFEMLTGELFLRLELTEGISRVYGMVSSPLPAPSSRSPALPPGFDAWFAGCTAREPTARFATARDAAGAFERLV